MDEKFRDGISDFAISKPGEFLMVNNLLMFFVGIAFKGLKYNEPGRI